MTDITCPHCGTPNPEDAVFCVKCGANLHEEQSDDRAAQTDQTPETPEADETGADRPRPTSLFDLGLAAPALEPVHRAEPPKPASPQQETEPEPSPSADQLNTALTRIPGLLTPQEWTSAGETPDDAGPLPAMMPPVGGDQALWLRRLFSQPPIVADEVTQASNWPNLRLRWIFLVLGVAVGFPILFTVRGGDGTSQQWPGVSAAHATIAGLPTNADVLIFWAYDPATAGELDLVAKPLMEHLIELQANVSIVSLLPTAPATAERLIAQAVRSVFPGPEANAVSRELTARNVYLSGGTIVLPILAQSQDLRAEVLGTPARMEVALVLAADAADVQAWLELVQPRNGTPVIAATSAAADPVLRPYWDSGQLTGLVSGFDGAIAYRELMARPSTEMDRVAALRQKMVQNWGQSTFLGLIVLGNVLALFFRTGEAGDD